MSGSTLSPWWKFLYATVATVLLLGLGELAARIAGVPDPRFASGQRIFRAAWLDDAESDAIMQGDADLFWRLRPGLHGRPWRKPLWIDTRTNSMGLRSPEISCPKPAGTFRVLCLGDSCTYGSGVRLGESYPARLEQMLNMVYEEGIYEVVNAGVPGYSSFQGRQFLRRQIERIQPDVVTIAFFHNDAGVWTGMSDEAMHAHLNETTGALLLKSALARAVATPFMRRADSGVALAREHRGVDSDDPAATSETQAPVGSDVPRATPAAFADHLEQLVRLTREHQAIPLLIVLPLKGQIDGTWPHQSPYQETIRQVGTRLDVPVLDLGEVLHGRPDLFIDNCHFKSQGCLLAARSLYSLLESLKVLPEPPDLEERRALRMNRLPGAH